MAPMKEHKLVVTDLIIPDVVDEGDTPLPLTPPTPPSPAQSSRRDLNKQSNSKMNCLCSPTTHVGSFRCRLHRGANFMRGSASVGSGLSDYSATGAVAAGGSLLAPRQSLIQSEACSSNRSFGSLLSSETAASGDASVMGL